MSTKVFTALIGLLCVAGCHGASSAPSPTLNLSGTWTGTFGPFANTFNSSPLPGRSNSWTIRWVAAQTGANVTGSVTVSFNTELAQSLTATGTLSGTLNSTQLTLTLAVPSAPGNFCSFTSSGSVTASGSAIAGSLSDSFQSCNIALTPCDTVNACLAVIPPSTSQLTLTKQ